MRIEDRALPAVGAAAAREQDTGVAAAARMLGLPGFRGLTGAEFDGELQVQVETTADLVGCPSCSAVAVLHDRRLRLVRDLPAGGRPVLLCWSKRVWRYRHRACPTVTFSERTGAIRPKGVLTERAGAEACRRVGQDAHSVAQVAADLGVGWPTVMRAVAEFGHRILDAAWVDRAVVRLGVDETAFLAATARRHTQFVTGLVDLAPATGGPARLLDVVEGRSGAVVTDWLAGRSPTWCSGVQVAALDPFRGYDTAFRAGLPTATVVLDPFHAIKLAQNTIDTVHRRVQQESLGHRGRRSDPPVRDPAGPAPRGGEPHPDQLRATARRPGRRRPTRAGRGRVDRHPRAAPRLRSPPGRTSCSPTSPPTGSGCCCTAASPGTLTAPHESGDAHHAWCRRAAKRVRPSWSLATVRMDVQRCQVRPCRKRLMPS